MPRPYIVPALIALICTTMPASADPPARSTVLKGAAARQVLKQCSRPTPQAGSGFFRPTMSEIVMLDRAVAASRNAGLPASARTTGDLQRRYAVEVVGILRSGGRFIYGNYYPLDLQDGVKHAPSTPTIVCDGGRQFFGAEMDLKSGRISHMAFNGRP